jgi:hypothetical protein
MSFCSTPSVQIRGDDELFFVQGDDENFGFNRVIHVSSAVPVSSMLLAVVRFTSLFLNPSI